MADTQDVYPSCEICFCHYLPYDSANPQTPDRRPFIVCANGHSLCRSCIHRILVDQDDPTCPHCRASFLETPIINRDLLRAVEVLSKRIVEIHDIDIKELELEGRPFSSGAFGDVFKAKWNTQDVAVKAIRSLDEMKKQMQTLSLEANLAIGLHHPNIIRLFGTTTMRDGRFAIVMEYAEKGSLEKYRKNMEQQLAVRVCLGIVDGLEFVHSRRVAHRDLKPGNILLFGPEMTPKLADFGVAKLIHTLVTNSAMIGTPKYAPPELLTPRSVYGCPADIFSLAVILFEVFTGRDAESDLGDNPMQIMLAVVQGLRPKLPESVPSPLKDVISRGWEKEAASRPPLSDFRSVLVGMKDDPISTEEDNSVFNANPIPLSLEAHAADVAGAAFSLPVMSMRWGSESEWLNSKEARLQMVEEIRRKSNMSKVINAAVLNVMEVIPRHLFVYKERVSGMLGIKNASEKHIVDLAYAYNRAMPATKVSNESSPEIIGTQLSMAEIIPGQSVLTVGIKGGYIQSLIAQLVGVHGRVVTVTSHKEALDICRDRVNKDCPFSQVVNWFLVDDVKDPENISKFLTDKKYQFHTIIYCGAVNKFPMQLYSLLHPVGNVSIIAPVKDDNGDKFYFKILSRQQNVQQMKIIMDFSVAFEDVK